MALVLALAATACSVEPEDDRFARSFIEHVRTRSPAGARQLLPEGEMARAGWNVVVARTAPLLPAEVPDSVVLVAWERLRDPQGAARKLTYRMYAVGSFSIVEVWLEEEEGRRFVETLRVSRGHAGP